MSLRYFYRPDWRSNPSVEITDNVRLYTLDITENAEESNPAMFRIVLDDPDGVLDIPSWTRIWATETAISASSNTHVFDGYIQQRTYHRAGDGGDSNYTSTARTIDVDIADENSIVSRRVMSSPDANRPAETDVQRVQWLANHADGQLLIDDTTFLFTANAVTMDANDYRGQTGADVLNDCAQAAAAYHKNHYFYFKEGIGSAIWYGSEDHTAHNSMLRLSNVLGDIDNVTTFAIGIDTQLVRDPSRQLSGVYYQFTNGATYVRNQSMFPEIGMRDLPFSSTNVKSLGQATTRANAYLADNDSEYDRITTTVRLPATKVNWIRAGMNIQFRAVHLPSYEQFTTLRVYRRSVVQDSEDPNNTYLLTLELGINSVPPSPLEQGAAGLAVITADLEIGSASHIGGASDRSQQWATDVGESTYTLVNGRQYRFVAQVLDCLSIPIPCADPSILRNQSHMNAPILALNNGAGSTALIANTFNWSPGSCTTTSQGICASGGISFGWADGTCGTPEYRIGQSYTGDWLTFSGPTFPAADISITGTPISGFYGFHWTVHLELQERTP